MKRQECGAKRGKPIWNPIGNLMALHENNSGMDPLRTTGQDFRLRTNPTGSGSDVAELAVPTLFMEFLGIKRHQTHSTSIEGNLRSERSS